MMNRMSHFAVAVLVGGLLIGPVWSEDRQDQNKQDPKGQMAGDVKGVSQLLGQVVEASSTPDGISRLNQYFSKDDMQRFKDSKADNQQLTTALTELQKNWREKYKGDFRVANADQVFGQQFFRYSGQEGEARPAGGRIEGSGNTGATSTIMVPASHGQPEVTANLVKEGNDWKINLPDTLTPEQLQTRLAAHISLINRDKQHWPGDQAEAQRLIGHHVLLALSGKEMGDPKNQAEQPKDRGNSGGNIPNR